MTDIIEAMAQAMCDAYRIDALAASMGRDNVTRSAVENRIIELRAALRAAEEAGWVLVPKEADEDMVEAGTGAFWDAWAAAVEENRRLRNDPKYEGRAGCQFIPQAWRAMVEAAPKVM